MHLRAKESSDQRTRWYHWDSCWRWTVWRKPKVCWKASSPWKKISVWITQDRPIHVHRDWHVSASKQRHHHVTGRVCQEDFSDQDSLRTTATGRPWCHSKKRDLRLEVWLVAYSTPQSTRDLIFPADSVFFNQTSIKPLFKHYWKPTRPYMKPKDIAMWQWPFNPSIALNCVSWPFLMHH